ncbi:MAG: hypothetical protein H6822_05775 [Planctomycetaceae bacterium]|nr:hypothetical protein [Planctomycetales bacterium]MCB9921668.1 hypothetical protein [Planctomycetaceae bacterium]
MATQRLALIPDLHETKQDDDLKKRLVNVLHSRHVPGGESVHFHVKGGTVVAHGPMRSMHAKWLCVECCRHVAGVIKFVDELVVDVPRRSRPRARSSAIPCG